MLKTHDREKLLDAVLYFATHTKNCGKTKLYKLLFLLDFEHFKQTGRNVTGMEYFAFPMGPVPGTLNDELDEGPADDFSAAIDVKPEWVGDYRQYTVIAKREFNPSHFSKRELGLLDAISNAHCYKSATQMVEITHAENGVWDRVFAGGEGKYQPIPYELALDGNNAACLIENAKEFAALKHRYAA